MTENEEILAYVKSSPYTRTVNYDFAKWKKLKNKLEEDWFKVGVTSVWNCPKSKKEFFRGYERSMAFVLEEMDKLDEEYEGYKIESANRGGQN